MAEVRWSEQALGDLDAACLFIARDAPVAARMFARKAFEATDRLENFPLLGKSVPELDGEDIRELVVGSYRVIYRYISHWDVVEILTLHHAARPLDLSLGNDDESA